MNYHSAAEAGISFLVANMVLISKLLLLLVSPNR